MEVLAEFRRVDEARNYHKMVSMRTFTCSLKLFKEK
jgi:hypothetical protein